MFTKFSSSKLLQILVACSIFACVRVPRNTQSGGSSHDLDEDDLPGKTSEQSVEPFNHNSNKGDNSNKGGGGVIVLQIPLPNGMTILCTQGAGGEYTHYLKSTANDLDFDTSNVERWELYASVSGYAYVHTFAATGSGFGNHVCIDLGNGYYVVIAHLDEIIVCDGCEVAVGQLIGIEGCTGKCTGDHVHVGLHKGDATLPAENGESVPATYVVSDSSGEEKTLESEQFVCGLGTGKKGDDEPVGKYYTSALPVALSHPDGTLVKTAHDSKVYLISNGEVRWITNENVFWSLGYDFSDLVIISDEELACYKKGVDISDAGFVKAVRDPLGQIWLLNGLANQWNRYRIKVDEIGWESVLSSWGLSYYTWDPPPIVDWSNSYLSNWPEKDGLAQFRNGTLIKEYTKSDVYVAEQNVAMPIKDWHTFTLLGFGERPIIEVDSGVVLAVQKVVGDCASGIYCISSEVVTTCGHSMLVAKDEPYIDQDDTGEIEMAGFKEEAGEAEEAEEDGSRRLQPALDSVSFIVTYPYSAPRTLNVQAYYQKSDLGGWWDKSEFDSDNDVSLSFEQVPDGICGFRLNVSEGNPATSWLCAGNGITASLDPDASIEIIYKGVIYTTFDLTTWSAPGGPASGCSALLKIGTANECNP
ncbi:M23 family metallopeptidase [Candidatus Uhrbacteria bacterium]|nr:M23 family metallopeptidase [Candidatus Uhrbacteria bacterium]